MLKLRFEPLGLLVIEETVPGKNSTASAVPGKGSTHVPLPLHTLPSVETLHPVGQFLIGGFVASAGPGYMLVTLSTLANCL